MITTRTDVKQLTDQAQHYQKENDLFSFLKWYEENFHKKNKMPRKAAEILADMLLAFKSSLPEVKKEEYTVWDNIGPKSSDSLSTSFICKNDLTIYESKRFNFHKCLLARHLSNHLSKEKKQRILSICSAYLEHDYIEFDSREEKEKLANQKTRFFKDTSSVIEFTILYNFIKKRAFQYAVLNNDYKKVDFLLKNNLAVPEANNNFCLRLASLEGYTEIVTLLMQDKRVDPAAGNFFSLKAAIYFNHLSIVKILFESGKINPEKIKIVGELTLIKMSLPKGRPTQFAVTTYLMEKNIQPLKIDFFPAVCHGNMAIIKKLIKEGLDPSMNQNRALCLAASNGHVDVMKYLLSDFRVDPAENSNTPLFDACYRGQVNAVSYLLAHPKVRPSFKHLSIACQYGRASTIALLLKDPRIDPREEKGDGINLLTLALSSKRFDSAVVLMNDLRMKTPENFKLIREFKQKYDHRYINFCLFKESFTLGRSNPQALFYKDQNGKKFPEQRPSFSGFPVETLAEIGKHLFADIQLNTHLLFSPPPKKLEVMNETFSFYQSKNSISSYVLLKFASRKEARAFVEKYKIIPEIWNMELRKYLHIIDMQKSPGFAVVMIPSAQDYYERFKNKHPELKLRPLDKLNVEPAYPYREECPTIQCINKMERYMWNLPENKKKYQEIIHSVKKMIAFLEGEYVKFNQDDYTILTTKTLGKIIKECPEAHNKIKKPSVLNRIRRHL